VPGRSAACLLLLLRPVVLVVLLVGTQAAVAEPANSNQEQGNRGEREEGRKRVCRDAHLASSPIVGAHVSVNTPEAVRRARVDERAAAARWARAEVATKVSSLVHQPHAAPAPQGLLVPPLVAPSLHRRAIFFCCKILLGVQWGETTGLTHMTQVSGRCACVCVRAGTYARFSRSVRGEGHEGRRRPRVSIGVWEFGVCPEGVMVPGGRLSMRRANLFKRKGYHISRKW